ncbi:unnamed protein product [Rotaria sp. Silwood2]|nr:unnamed protein product [Rotaria sp. Silwood2]
MASTKMFIIAMFMLIFVIVNILPGSFAVPVNPSDLEDENPSKPTPTFDEDVYVRQLSKRAKFGPGTFRRPWGSGWAWSDLM